MGRDDADGSDDKRVHARISVSVPIQVNGPQGSCRAMLTDLSRGGARFVAHKTIGTDGDSVEVFLPYANGVEIGILGEIVRADPTERGQDVAIRFAVVEPGSRKSLDSLLDALLSATGGGRRRHPRVARRLGLPSTHLRAVLEDVSRGGLSMTVTQGLVLDEEVVVVIPDTRGEDLLTMRARVVTVRTVRNDDAPALYRVGLSFGDLLPERRRCLDALLDALAKK